VDQECSRAEAGSITLVTGKLTVSAAACPGVSVLHCAALFHDIDILFPHLLISLSFSLVYCRPEPHILLFRRPLGTNPVSGEVDPELEREAKERYHQELAINQSA
jgi:hypothetical protein